MFACMYELYCGVVSYVVKDWQPIWAVDKWEDGDCRDEREYLEGFLDILWDGFG